MSRESRKQNPMQPRSIFFALIAVGGLSLLGVGCSSGNNDEDTYNFGDGNRFISFLGTDYNSWESLTDPFDFGDAPDGRPTGYLVGVMQGTFKTTTASNGARTKKTSEVWLGEKVNREGEPNMTDKDEYDDGVAVDLQRCQTSTAEVAVHVRHPGKTTGTAYLNLYFDWDKNGRWGGRDQCAPEWVVRNFPIDLSKQEQDIQLYGLQFRAGGETEDLWYRAVISLNEQAKAEDGSGAFASGEVEDYGPHHALPPDTPTDKAFGAICEPDPLVIQHGTKGTFTISTAKGSIPITDTELPIGFRKKDKKRTITKTGAMSYEVVSLVKHASKQVDVETIPMRVRFGKEASIIKDCTVWIVHKEQSVEEPPRKPEKEKEPTVQTKSGAGNASTDTKDGEKKTAGADDKTGDKKDESIEPPAVDAGSGAAEKRTPDTATDTIKKDAGTDKTGVADTGTDGVVPPPKDDGTKKESDVTGGEKITEEPGTPKEPTDTTGPKDGAGKEGVAGTGDDAAKEPAEDTQHVILCEPGNVHMKHGQTVNFLIKKGKGSLDFDTVRFADEDPSGEHPEIDASLNQSRTLHATWFDKDAQEAGFSYTSNKIHGSGHLETDAVNFIATYPDGSEALGGCTIWIEHAGTTSPPPDLPDGEDRDVVRTGGNAEGTDKEEEKPYGLVCSPLVVMIEHGKEATVSFVSKTGATEKPTSIDLVPFYKQYLKGQVERYDSDPSVIVEENGKGTYTVKSQTVHDLGSDSYEVFHLGARASYADPTHEAEADCVIYILHGDGEPAQKTKDGENTRRLGETLIGALQDLFGWDEEDEPTATVCLPEIAIIRHGESVIFTIVRTDNFEKDPNRIELGPSYRKYLPNQIAKHFSKKNPPEVMLEEVAPNQVRFRSLQVHENEDLTLFSFPVWSYDTDEPAFEDATECRVLIEHNKGTPTIDPKDLSEIQEIEMLKDFSISLPPKKTEPTDTKKEEDQRQPQDTRRTTEATEPTEGPIKTSYKKETTTANGRTTTALTIRLKITDAALAKSVRGVEIRMPQQEPALPTANNCKSNINERGYYKGWECDLSEQGKVVRCEGTETLQTDKESLISFYFPGDVTNLPEHLQFTFLKNDGSLPLLSSATRTEKP